MTRNDLDEWITPTEVSEKYKIPVETIRRYLRLYSHHLKIKKLQKKYLIHLDSVSLIPEIRDLYADGKNVEEVEKYLEAKGLPLTITVDPEREANLEKQIQGLKDQLDQQQELNRQLLERQQEFNLQLLERLDQQQRYIDERMNERDRKLMESIRTLQEEKQARLETAASKEDDQKKKGFLSRLFGR